MREEEDIFGGKKLYINYNIKLTEKDKKEKRKKQKVTKYFYFFKYNHFIYSVLIVTNVNTSRV